MNYYPHHIGDYAKVTSHLTLIEDGAYRRMLDLYYATERPLPEDISALCRLLRARDKDEKDAVETVLKEYFTLTTDGWRKARCDEEIIRAQDKRTKAQRSADKRWHCEDDADAMPTHCDGNAPNPNPNPNPKVKPLARFAEFWADYPKKKSKGDAEKAWKAIDPGADLITKILDALRQAKQSKGWTKESGKYVPYPATWLRAKGWDDEYDVPQGKRLVV